eukprot:7391934-Prymnesium_polylepis.1
MAEGFAVQGYVLKLKKGLEGIKQGANLFFNLNQGVLTKLGMKSSLVETNWFTHPEIRIMMLVLYDDIAAAFAGHALLQYQRLKQEYSVAIKIETLEIVPISIFNVRQGQGGQGHHAHSGTEYSQFRALTQQDV